MPTLAGWTPNSWDTPSLRRAENAEYMKALLEYIDSHADRYEARRAGLSFAQLEGLSIAEGLFKHQLADEEETVSLINFHLQLKVTTEERWAQAKHSPAPGTTYMLWDEMVPRHICCFQLVSVRRHDFANK